MTAIDDLEGAEDIAAFDQEGQIVSSYGHFDGAEVVEDGWLTNSGNHRNTPCQFAMMQRM